MPKTTKSGEARKDELPGTLRRSNRKAQRTFAKAHDAAAEEYGSEERAHRRAGRRGVEAEVGGLHNAIPSAEGVDANASKKHLIDVARRLSVPGRSKMNKSELVDAIKKRNRRARGK